MSERDDESPLEIIFDHLHARGRGDAAAIAARLHPDVVQQGVEPELVCRGRDVVLERMRNNMGRAHGGIDWLELIQRDDGVVAGLAGSRFADDPMLPDSQLFIVFTVREGMITRIEHFRTRGDALGAAEARS